MIAWLQGGEEWLIGLFFAVLAVPGLGLRRFGPWPARAAVGLALAALLLALGDPRWLRRGSVPVAVQVLRTGPGVEGWPQLAERLQLPVEPTPAAAPDGELAATAARQWLAALGGDPAEVALLWTGPITPDEPAAKFDAGVHAWSAVPPAPLDPDRLQLRSARANAVGRAGRLELMTPDPLPGMQGRLVLTAPDGHRTIAELAPDAHGRLTHAWIPQQEGVHAIELELRISGSQIRARGQLVVAPAPRVVVAGGAHPAAARALQAQGFRVQEAAGELDLAEPPDLVLLLRAPHESEIPILQQFVDDGGGLCLAGGADGGAIPLRASPFATLSPITRAEVAAEQSGPGPGRTEAKPADPAPEAAPPAQPPPIRGATEGAQLVEGPPVEVDRRTIALVLLVDKSGSMSNKVSGQEAKIEYAKQSAYETAASLGEGDEVGLITFGESAYLQLPLTPATDRAAIREKLEGLRANENTTIVAPALERALELLAASRAGVRHAVIVSDGEIYDADEEFTQFAARRLRGAGVTVSLIRISAPGESALLASSAALASPGCFVNTFDPRAVPRLISAEVRRALTKAGRPPAGEVDPETVPPDAPPVLPPEPPPRDPEPPAPPPVQPPPAEPDEQGLEVRALSDSLLLAPAPERWPQLLGMLETAATLDAHVLLVAGEQGLPLLALCNRGTGRIAAWSADLDGVQSRDWLAAPGFPARLAQWLTALLPPVAEDPRDLLVSRELLPPAPRLAERDWLRAATGAEPGGVEAAGPAAAREQRRVRSLARELGLAGLLLLVLIAAVERLARGAV